MKRDPLAGANLTIAALVGVLLLVWIWVPRDPFAGIAAYLPFHMFAETFSIIVSMMIFGVMCNAHSPERSGSLIILSCAMLAAGLLDFGHMLSVSGMPHLVTASSPDKGIAFWLSARIMAAIGLFVAAVRPEAPIAMPRSRYALLGMALGIAALVYWMVLFQPQALPRFFVEGVGLTPVKVWTEYFLTGVLLVPALVFYRRARRSQSALHIGLYLAASVAVLGELYFSLYTARHDLFQVFGHAYKIVAYFFIYRAVFLHCVHEPFELLRREVAERKRAEYEVLARKQAEEALKDANERLEEADRRKNEFMATLSHELRNPLAPITNSLYILERVAPASDQAKRAQAVIARQVRQLARLVDDLLDVSRISRDKIRLQRRRLELNELVHRTIEDHRSVFEKNGVRLEVELEPTDIFVHADWDRLCQVVGNLLRNAANFTARGGSVRVSVAADTAACRALVCVTDTGIGMHPETLAKLFLPFMQADQSLDRSKGGLGLGLALVKGLVELHDGDVTAHSDGLGKGAWFTVRLPLNEVSAEPIKQPLTRVSSR